MNIANREGMGLFDSSIQVDEKKTGGQEPVIVGKDVSKHYGLTKALQKVSLHVPRGSVYALLGPNGAGKTTFVKSLLGLVHIDEGSISLQGRSVADPESRKGIAYLPEKFDFFPYYNVKGVLQFFGSLRGEEGESLHERMDGALKQLDIEDLAHKKLKTLSKGQLQRVGIAALLVSKSDIFILDEPFSGLDPIGRKEIKDIFLELKDSGKTLFINSHILAEMEKFCDQVAILHKGQCLVQGKIRELVQNQSLEDYFYEKIKSAKGG